MPVLNEEAFTYLNSFACIFKGQIQESFVGYCLFQIGLEELKEVKWLYLTNLFQ